MAEGAASLVTAEAPGAQLGHVLDSAARPLSLQVPGLLRLILSTSRYFIQVDTVGVIRICSLVFVNSSAQDASIFKISVAIFKRRSWGFQNTPNLWDLEHFKPSYGHLKKIEVSKNNFDWQFCSKYKQILNYLKTSLFSGCHNLAQNHPNFTSWGCFGILRSSSWRWPQRFWT